jgi:hypothetical protein
MHQAQQHVHAMTLAPLKLDCRPPALDATSTIFVGALGNGPQGLESLHPPLCNIHVPLIQDDAL